VTVIASNSNQKIKDVLRLRKHRERAASGRFVVEGARELRRALESDVHVDEVYVCPTFFQPDSDGVLEMAKQRRVDLRETTEAVFRRLSYRDAPDGLLAVARCFPTSLERLAPSGAASTPPLILVAAQIEKPGNLGTMVRSAAAAGATGLIVADAVTDVFNPNVVRSSQGAVFGLDIAVCDAAAAIEWLRTQGIAIHAAVPDAEVPYWQASLVGPTALVVGSEHLGVAPAWLEAADHLVTIPMPGSSGVDSLNAATAAAILLFDAARQRADAGSITGGG